MQERRRSGSIAGWVAVKSALVVLVSGLGPGSAARAEAQERTVTLAAHETARGSGDTVLSVDEVIDSRCRPAERCSASEAASRDAAVRLTLRAAGGTSHVSTLAIGGARGTPSASAPARIGLDDLLVELVDIAPAGRELPADGPGRVQRATLRLTPADRVLVRAGETVALPHADFSLRVASIDDHRCPSGVACGVAGYVQVDIELKAKDAPAERMVFGAPATPRRSHIWRGHEIALCGVLPRRTGPSQEQASSPLQADVFVSRAPGTRGGSSAAQAAVPITCASTLP